MRKIPIGATSSVASGGSSVYPGRTNRNINLGRCLAECIFEAVSTVELYWKEELLYWREELLYWREEFLPTFNLINFLHIHI